MNNTKFQPYETPNIHEYLLEKASEHLPSFASLLDHNGQLSLKPPHPKYSSLPLFMSKVIIEQQLSKKAAQSILKRVEDTAREYEISIETLFSSESFQNHLRACGISRNKVKAINGVLKLFEGNSSFEEYYMSLSYTKLQEEISSIWGMGSWSADMIAIFYFHLTDVWPMNDAGIIRGFKSLINPSNISVKDMAKLASHFSPFRSYFSLHIWKGIDTQIL